LNDQRNPTNGCFQPFIGNASAATANLPIVAATSSDLRHAFRVLIRQPVFAGAVIATLVLVIGASVAIVSVIQGMLLRPLPYPAGDRLIAIDASAGGELGKLASRELREIARDSRVIEDLAAFYPSQYNITGGGPPEALVTTIGTSNLFRVFGVPMLQGESWPEALDWNTNFTVVLGHGLWMRRYGGDPSVVGRAVQLDGAPYTVTGVLPPAFDYPMKTDLYRAVTGYTPPDGRRFTVVARLRQGATLAEAAAELDGFAARFAQMYPESNRGLRFVARPLRDVFIGRARPYLWLLGAAVLIVIVIACANLMNLMLARALQRRAELAVRTALGAGRWRIVRLAGTEALLVAALGALGGFFLGRWAVTAITAVARFQLPFWIDLQPDATTAAAAATLALMMAFAVSVLPALHVARSDVSTAVVASSPRAGGSAGQRRALAALVASQIAFAVVVLAGAALMGRTMKAIAGVDAGFQATNAVTFRTDPPWTRYGTIESVAEFYRRALERLAALPGAVAVTSNASLPFGGLPDVTKTVVIEGQAAPVNASEQPFVNYQVVSPDYFDVMKVPLRAGRVFTEHDRINTMPVAVISERAAARFWPGADPIGKRMRMTWRVTGTGANSDAEVVLTVIGVVGDVRFDGLAREPGLDLYASHFQTFAGDTFLVVMTKGDPASLAGSVARAVQDVDPDQSIFDVQLMRSRMDATVWQQRTTAAVLGALGVLAVVLAAVGVYGVLAYAVASRAREIGVRRALGASDRAVILEVLRNGMTPVVIGGVVGMVITLVTVRTLGGLLYGVAPFDPVSLLASPAVLGTVALLACLIPARRALMVHPADALRV
jgi:putative ABC transport system permease protein